MNNAINNHSERLLRPIHGGRLTDVINKYGIEKTQWLDLSTGINPHSWPVPDIPESVWRCLPDNDELIEIATDYYASDHILPTAGSQQSIELLPRLLGKSLRVGIVSPCYTEHRYAWQKNGHQVRLITPETIESHLPELDILLIVNPNNPTGYCFERKQLLTWLEYFQRHSVSLQMAKNDTGGKLYPSQRYLIVDEAFMDSTPENSLLPYVSSGHLVVLRSIGKFFGLAGIRSGFMFAPKELLNRMQQEMPPWSVNHPARWITSRALADKTWITENKKYLHKQSQQLRQLLVRSFGVKALASGCSLFQTVYLQQSEQVFHHLAQQGVLVRLLDNRDGLRFGLPGDLNAMNKLTNAMKVDFNWEYSDE